MRTPIYLFLFLAVALTLLPACNDDDDMSGPMVPTVNMTTLVVGSYSGTNKYGEDGSYFTEEDRQATATRTTDSTASISIRSTLAGTLDFVATMDTDSTFRVADINIFDEGPYSGTGTVSADSIVLRLTASGTKEYDYDGARE